jgi:hypothetical protein
LVNFGGSPLIAGVRGPKERSQQKEVVGVHSERRVLWFLPFLLSAAVGLGALLGLALFTDGWSQEGPSGDAAGAAGALFLVLSVGVSFVSASLMTMVAGLARRGVPTLLLVRLGSGVVAGVVIGALAPNQGATAAVVMWIGLLGVPAVLCWPWWRTAP